MNLRLAWGMEIDRDLSFEGWNFPDRTIRQFLADAFWQGAFVDRWTVLHVDGGRCYMPYPNRFGVDTVESVVEGHDEGVAWTARASHVALARLLNDIVRRPEPGMLERHMEQADVIEVPDE